MNPKIIISNAVNKQLIEDAKTNNRDYSYFHASEWSRCHRKIAYAYYESKGYIKTDSSSVKIDVQLQRIFDNGHYMHKRWSSYLEKTGMLRGVWKCTNIFTHDIPKVFGEDDRYGVLKPEACVCGNKNFDYIEIGFSDPETLWGGHVDAILDIGTNDDMLIVDFKSINPFGFSKLTAAKDDHITQIQIYLYLSGLKYGIVLYENKADQALKEFFIERDDEYIAAKKQEALSLKQVVEGTNSDSKKVLPLRAYTSKGCTECLRCKFRADCWQKRNKS